MNEKAPGPVSSSRQRARRLRMAGIIALALGTVAAGVVYWIGTRSPDLSNDPSMLGFNRAEARQMGLLYGNQGLLIERWAEDLKQPGTQAILIALFSILLAAGCFYFARLLDIDDEPV